MATVDLSTNGEIATLTLNNPGKLNAINLAMWQDLAGIMGKLAVDRDIRCIVLRGAGHDAFAAGGDLEEFVTGRATLEQALHYHEQVALALNAIADCPHPTVALIQGACIGGGLEIAGVCDLRISNESARFGAPINRLGFSMYPGEMEGLLKLAGAAVMKEILLEGRILNATEAYEKGLITRVVPDPQVEDEAYATARRICAGAPLVAGWHKQWIRRLQNGRPLNDEEKAASFAFLDTEDYKEGLSAFLEKRKPAFKAC
ncbi:enoyl-CoA hydratase/isomerase family protein [Dechloromonas sp. TW-R-39-2]|uniref:enoyl-CoA hydratase/isomerase family protein n=1 Tax=Dechloromonas sp. TW-R-39-2 TaxID=2654218 RepID=UPI00193D8989|nr:enoyl-CoA hydratase-related protein [Dechloromonas sp. TW-R-39-2]QRM18070.1 enoyl-CoA hydratase/isomerase family protein [Dechloromonas sp. TW-R-39-2]